MALPNKNRFIKLKRYEDILRKSMESFNKIFEQTTFNFFYQNPISYRFEHRQLKKKGSFMLSLKKKSSLNQFKTMQGHKRHVSQPTSQETKKYADFRLRTFNQKDLEIYKPKQRSLHSDASLVITPNRCKKQPRPRTVSPGIRRKEPSTDQKQASGNKVVWQKYAGNPGNSNVSLDNEISPW
jgi:hypothetical protein